MNPCTIDYVATKIMGFNPNYIKQVTEPFRRRRSLKYSLVDFDIKEISVISNINDFANIGEIVRDKSLKFRAPKGWEILER